MPEINEGYEIIAAEVYAVTDFGREERVVLGRMDTRHGTMFVTWESQVWTFSDGERDLTIFGATTMTTSARPAPIITGD